MRDLLNLIDTVLTEANLSAAEIPAKKTSAVTNPRTKKLFSRPELFLYKVKNQLPFTLVSGGEVVINPRDAKKVSDWLATGPKGTITLRTMDGSEVKNTELLKTVEFGSKEAETIPIKASQVFDVQDIEVRDLNNSMQDILSAGGFPASQMYEKLANNPALKKMGKLGDAVIYMAQQANARQVPKFPTNLKPEEIKAIELYASEYLGALGLIRGSVPFVRGSREQFEEFVGSDLQDLIMYFPKASNNPLADSFSVVNDDTGHAIKISSKAAGKGAPPSITSMKFPADVRRKYPEATEFLERAQDPNQSMFTQPFDMMNYLYEIVPESVPREYHSLLPFTPALVDRFDSSFRSGDNLPRSIMKPFERRLSEKVAQGSAADGGKAWYAVTTDMMRIVNGGAIPGWRAAMIESLGYNFVQLYSNVRGDKLVTEAFWPAKISGQVKLKTKGSAGEMKGKFSVEISPGGADIDTPALPDRPDTGKKPKDKERLTGPGAKAARQAAAPKTDAETLGRARRKTRA